MTKHRATSPENSDSEHSRKRGRSAKSKNSTSDADAPESDASNDASSHKVKKEQDEKTSHPKVKAEPKQEPGDNEALHVKKEEEQEDVKIESGHRILEKGQAYFFYRQKIDVDQASGPEDVQKLYLLLSPDEATGRLKAEDKSDNDKNTKASSGESKAKHRLIIIPRKELPVKGRKYNQPGSRNWAFVDAASPDLSVIEKNLGEYSYSTKTRGDRTQTAARLVGEARYEIVYNLDHRPHTSHFLYRLEVPAEPGPVQESFNIETVGQFMIQIKNPRIQTAATERGAQRYATLKQAAAKLPKHLQEKFRGIRQEEVRYRPIDTPEFLDIPHVELLLLAVGMQSNDELAEALKELENEANEEIKEEIDSEERPEDHTYKELKLDESTIPNAVNEFK
ncbi:hypothetical protein BGZ94_005199 [Podila epigama]|nr:hypothetical protein BGZ94_005199 [Podila epigama]